MPVASPQPPGSTGWMRGPKLLVPGPRGATCLSLLNANFRLFHILESTENVTQKQDSASERAGKKKTAGKASQQDPAAANKGAHSNEFAPPRQAAGFQWGGKRWDRILSLPISGTPDGLTNQLTQQSGGRVLRGVTGKHTSTSQGASMEHSRHLLIVTENHGRLHAQCTLLTLDDVRDQEPRVLESDITGYICCLHHLL